MAKQRVISESAQGGVATSDKEPRTAEQARIEANIRELLAAETNPILLSNQLFSPDGLFGQLAQTQQERQKVAQSELFRQAQRRVFALRQKALDQTNGSLLDRSDRRVVSGEEALYTNLMRLGAGFEACRRQELIVPALIVLYSAIDTAGWLDSDQVDATRKSFTKWVDRYLLQAKPLPCTAMDLYAARCGLLHTSTAASKLAREGRARKILYAWGDGKAERLQRVIELRNDTSEYVALDIDELYDAWQLGSSTFIEELAKDPVRRSNVHARAQQFFTDWGVEVVDELISVLDDG